MSMIMKQFKLLEGNVLGVILSVLLTKKSKRNKTKELSFYKETVKNEDLLDYSLLSKQGLLQTKTILSPRTFIEGKFFINHLRKKADAVLTISDSSMYGAGSLLDRAEKLENYLKYLKRKYRNDKDIDYREFVRMVKDYPEVEKTLLLRPTFTTSQILELKSYLKKYYKQYANRELEGQQRLYLPDYYTKYIISYIASPEFVNKFGYDRLSINSTGIPLFCHSILHLQKKGLIKIRDIELAGDKVRNATIDNLIPKSTLIDKAVKQDEPKQFKNPLQVSSSPPKNVLECGKLKISIDQGVIYNGSKASFEISPDNGIFKLLVLLIQSKRIVEYKEIAREVKMNCWYEGATNKSIARYVQFLKRDLSEFLRDNLKMSEIEIKKMIISKKNVGYILRCS